MNIADGLVAETNTNSGGKSYKDGYVGSVGGLPDLLERRATDTGIAQREATPAERRPITRHRHAKLFASLATPFTITIVSSALAGPPIGGPFRRDSEPRSGVTCGVWGPKEVSREPASDDPDDVCSTITTEMCANKNSAMFAFSAGYVVISVLTAARWRAYLTKKKRATAKSRFLQSLALSGAAAGLLARFGPPYGAVFRCCEESSVFSPEIFLQDAATVRAFLLGALPAAVCYTAVTQMVGKRER